MLPPTSTHTANSEAALKPTKEYHQSLAQIPRYVHKMIRSQTVVVQYKRSVRKKRLRDVVIDIANAIPKIEELLYVWKLPSPPKQPLRFLIFLPVSNGLETPHATSLRGNHRTLANALCAKAASAPDPIDFVCRPVRAEEKVGVANLITGSEPAFEGASVVLERDREVIALFEEQYKADVEAYQSSQKRTALVPKEGGRDNEGEHVEAEATDSSKSSTPPHSTIGQRAKSLRRAGGRDLEPITPDDRRAWVEYAAANPTPIVAGVNSYDALKDFLATVGRDRRWTTFQWNTYLRDNKTTISRQVDKLKMGLLSAKSG
ncbi:hypothetical protein FRB90_004518 [Tulasnella sp. 427]|nr:hypothetical protein FRB90_004518 [Tulasnella sp. 427]